MQAVLEGTGGVSPARVSSCDCASRWPSPRSSFLVPVSHNLRVLVQWFSPHLTSCCDKFFRSLLLLPFLPCLALPCLALPCLALPCLALPCLALPCLAFTSVSTSTIIIPVVSLSLPLSLSLSLSPPPSLVHSLTLSHK